MCTVTFLPTENGFVFTSNRDEKVIRPTIPPAVYQHAHQSLIYPKDQQAGGTWIATNGANKIACLLNGAFFPHIKKTTYSRSRGTVVLEVFNHESMEAFVQNTSFEGVEPFTLVLIDVSNNIAISELRWDETNCYVTQLDPLDKYIWSSVTLYGEAEVAKRNTLFQHWFNDSKNIAIQAIQSFHRSSIEDSSILLTETNGVKTVSITQITCANNHFDLFYHDLIAKSETRLICSENQLVK